jgi:acetyl esterase/lipase
VVKADVYGSDANLRKPVILWIHGGALIFGSRATPPEWLNPDEPYVVVSIDYRLAPETKLPAIIGDLQDAYRWVREQGPRLFYIDPRRMCVAGESAGGYLTLMAGFSVSPLPTVLLSLSGYGDITLPWYSRPSLFYLRLPLVSRGEAFESVGTHCVSGSPQEGEHRDRFYLYCRQKGIWPREVAGHDPVTENRWFDPYCPMRNVSEKFPPTLLIHGSGDTDVPYEESVRMDERLSKFNVKHRFLRVPGGSHCLATDAPAVRDPVFRQAIDFVRAQMG